MAQQQLRRLSDASYLEGELKEGIILLSWGSVSAADISRLSNLIKQATAVTAAAVEAARGTGASARAGVGVRQDILLAAKAALEAAEDFSGGPKTATSIHSVFAIENYPGLAINEQIQRAKVSRRPCLNDDIFYIYRHKSFIYPLHAQLGCHHGMLHAKCMHAKSVRF